jgi:hypothetical protein
LTPKGREQALRANEFWKVAARKEEIPFPEIIYTSPLWRCVETANLTFADNIQFNRSKEVIITEASTHYSISIIIPRNEPTNPIVGN